MRDGFFGKRWWRFIRRAPGTEAKQELQPPDLDDELAFHLEQRVRDYVARGMEPEAARAAALERLGDLEGVRREYTKLLTTERRAEARHGWLKVSWLDFKLGFRMLVKYPGLTMVGGFAMAFAIWVGAGAFEFMTQVVYPKLPLDEGDHIVAIRLWDAAESEVEPRALHDFVAWRAELRSVRELGAFRTRERNLITGDGRGLPVEVAEITAAGFRVARVAPLLGRSLVPADEEAGASPVIVLGYDIWQRRFAGDPDVVGQGVRLGREHATVVGVMPEGFKFPVSHSAWTPLRLSALDQAPGGGPAIQVLGRLAPGASLDEAQAELTALGRRAAATYPDTHEHLRPQVMPYAKSILNIPAWASLGLLSINGFIVVLLVLVCGNVALLMFARAATRENEILVRHALGASRGRIVTQLFAEALVLSAVAAAVGLAAASFGLRWWMGTLEGGVLEGRLPFWFRDSLSAVSVLYAVGLTVLAAIVSGVVPALKMTGRDLEGHLRQGTASGGGPRFGGVWTAVIVTQVAFTTFLPMIALGVQEDMARIRSHEVGFPAEEYLAARLELDREQPAGAVGDSTRAEQQARVRAMYLELERRLAADPRVAGVTFASALPGASHPWRRVEVDEGGAVPPWHPPGYRVRVASVAADYFEVLGTPILSGRGFDAGDVESGQPAVIVNRAFVDRVLGGRNPIGRRVRYLPGDPDEPRSPDNAPGPWYEIVGVVNGLGTTNGTSELVEGLFHPVAPAAAEAIHLAVHVRGEPESFAPRLRRLATVVDPTLRMDELIPLDEVARNDLQFYGFWSWLIGLLTVVALVLSWAGIYAVMSFTVSRRTREIGVRVALGGDARRILFAIFRRPLAQVTLGVAAGALLMLVAWIVLSDPGSGPTPSGVARLGALAALMMGVCMLACIVPTRRALRVEPTEALRADG